MQGSCLLPEILPEPPETGKDHPVVLFHKLCHTTALQSQSAHQSAVREGLAI